MKAKAAVTAAQAVAAAAGQVAAVTAGQVAVMMTLIMTDDCVVVRATGKR